MVEVSKNENDVLKLLAEFGFNQIDSANKTNNYFFVKGS